jgi:Fur family ferric uptake transcriptional regulator
MTARALADGASTGHVSIARAPAESWTARAEVTLAAAGHKRGGARRARSAGRSPIGRRVSRASVYRILDELEQLSLVQRVETGQAMVRYERVCEPEHHHHHLVCDECGLVMPFSDPALERAIDKLSEKVPLVVSEHEIVLHGACRDCRDG